MTDTSNDLARWRADTPGCRTRNHLNNAGSALPPEAVTEAMQAHLRLEAEIGGYEAADEASDLIGSAYTDVGRLIGAEARNLAMTQNATVAFALALSAFDFRPGDVILTTRNDYISNQINYLSLQRRQGVEVVRAEDAPEGGVDPQSVRELIRRHRPRLVAVTHVPTNSGLVQPVEAVGEICTQAEVPYLVDACQSVGQLPVDVRRLRCDFLSVTARKFLRGPRGVGFLYVSDRALGDGLYPLYIDMRGAEWTAPDDFQPVADARRFESWELNYAGVIGLGEAARYALEVGIERGGGRARELADHAREQLSAVAGIRVLDRGPELCAIVTAEVEGWHAPELVGRLRERGINTAASLRDYAVIDMTEKEAASAVRISPHYYNTREEVDACVDTIEELAQV
ncbi:MAG TPA: aminotransferase class V-fold PLP-dependent enzyme [Longimicrobiaceae bacterium]|nr:aminotransferase class V-fold PLP-dependent enzyme [Longimicrobiaceae bacterium]